MSWHTFKVLTSQFGEREANKLSSEVMHFTNVNADGNSKDIAIYSKLAYDGSHFIYYFSPKASEVASILLELYNAKKCNPPSANKSVDYSKLEIKGGDRTFWSRSA